MNASGGRLEVGRHRPDVWAEFPAADSVIGGGLDPERKSPSSKTFAFEDRMQLRVRTDPKLTLQLHDIGDTASKVHGPKNIHYKRIVNPPNLVNPFLGLECQDSRMVRKRPETTLDIDLFIAEVRALKERTGKSHKVIAEGIGIEVGYLHKILYRDKPLTIQVAEKSAHLFGKVLKDFLLGYETPNEEPFDSGFAKVMGTLGPNIPEDVKKNLISIAQSYQPKDSSASSKAVDTEASTNVIDAIWHDLSPESQAAMLAFGKSLQNHNHRKLKAENSQPVKTKRTRKIG